MKKLYLVLQDNEKAWVIETNEHQNQLQYTHYPNLWAINIFTTHKEAIRVANSLNERGFFKNNN